MFQAGEIISEQELQNRREKAQQYLALLCPEAEGLMLFSSLNIYYLTGTMGKGLLWLPLKGSPLLFTRKGKERAKIESPLTQTFSFKSYGEVLPLLQEHGYSPRTIAVEKAAISWQLSELLVKKLSLISLVTGDMVMQRTRSVKTPWEMNKLRIAGNRHKKVMEELLPAQIRHGMTEREISHIIWENYFALGHCGITRMSSFGDENFLGHVAVQENGNYPSYFNGPLGLMGEHPSAPVMGNAGCVWKKNTMLSVDTGFVLEGYNTDKTQIYFSGKPSEIPLPLKKAQEVCQEIEKTIAAACKPGAIPSKLYQKAISMAEQAGFKEGFMGSNGNKVPFLGHGIGLAIDEWPVLANKFDMPLEKNMVIAIEPKISLNGYGMPGSENTYLVTEKGGISLSGDPATFICIEK